MDPLSMDAELYRAAMKGDSSVFKIEETWVDYLLTKSPNGNNIIHIAAQHGHPKFIDEALKHLPIANKLLHDKNKNEDTPLHVAAEFGNKEAVAFLISHLISNDGIITTTSSCSSVVPFYMVKNKQGDTPLHVALRNARVEVVDEFFDVVVPYHPEILSSVNDHCETPLHLFVCYCAARKVPSVSTCRWIREGILNSEGVYGFRVGSKYSPIDMLQKFISQYSDAVCLHDKEGWTPILRAASDGNLPVVSWLLYNCPQSAEVCNAKGRNLLHLIKPSARECNEFKKLVTMPEIIILKDQQDWMGDTPGHVAVRNRDYVKVRILSESLADFTITNKEGVSVGDLIDLQSDYFHEMEAEMHQYMPDTVMSMPLYEAALTGNCVKLRRRCMYGENSYFTRTLDGRSILHVAIQHGHSAYVEEALKRFPSLILTRDYSGDTPLHVAARIDNKAARLIARFCKDYVEKAIEHLKRPIEVSPWETKNSSGYTPLQEAFQARNFEIALDLINLYDRRKLICKDDPESPLHMLARNAPNSVNKLQSLMSPFVENRWGIIDQHDIDGLTPLMTAAQYGRFLLVVMILHIHPQSVNSRDLKGRNFLHHLRMPMMDPGEMDRITWLCRRVLQADQVLGSSMLQDHDGNTPLHLAIMNAQFEIAQMMMIQWIDQVTLKTSLGIRNNEGKSISDLISNQLHLPITLRDLIERVNVGKILDEKIYAAAEKGDDTIFDLKGKKQGGDGNDNRTSECGVENPNKAATNQTGDGNNREKSACSGGILDKIETKQGGVGDDDEISRCGVENNLETKQGEGDNDNSSERDDDFFTSRAVDGSNIIHISIRQGQTSFMEGALESFPNLTFQKDLNGDTPLHVAARLKTPTSLKFLELSCTNWRDKVKEDDLLRVDLPPWLVKNFKGNTPLLEAARTSNDQALCLLTQYASPEAYSEVNDNGETALHLVATYSVYKVTELCGGVLKIITNSSSAASMRALDGSTPLLRAIKSGRMRMAGFIIASYPESVEIRDYKRRTLLHHLDPLAVDFADDSEDALQNFIVHVADFVVDGLRTAVDEDGNTPLHLAIIRGNVPVVKFLMERCLESQERLELSMINNDGYSICQLLSSTHIPAMDELWKSMPLSKRRTKERALLAAKNMDDKIYEAVMKGNTQIFRVEIPVEADVESGPLIYVDADFLSQTPDGSNLLHIALRHGKQETVRFVEKLLDRFPALILQPDSGGDTPVHLAAQLCNPVSIKVLDLAGDSYLKAMDEGKVGIFLNPFNQKNLKGNMPIHEALQYNNCHSMESIISTDPGAVSKINDLGETPLHLYARCGVLYRYSDGRECDVTSFLITQNKGSVFLRDNEGLTPLLRAAKCGRFRAMRRILEHCPQSAYLRDPNGRTFLHLLRFTSGDVLASAADYIFEWMGKKLFEIPEVDAQRFARDCDGNTPLHYAIKTGNYIAAEAITRRCLESDINELLVINNEGESSLELLGSGDVPTEIVRLVVAKNPGMMYAAGSSFGIRKTEIRVSTSSFSVIAGLLASITFGAALHVPGGFDSENGSPVLLRKAAFQLFLVSDAIAMCSSMIVLFFLLWVMACGKVHGSYILLDLSMTLLQTSFYSTLVAFMTGVYVVTAHKALWIAVFVCMLCSIVMLITWKSVILFLVKKIRLLIDGFIAVKCLSLKKFQKKAGMYCGISDSSSVQTN